MNRGRRRDEDGISDEVLLSSMAVGDDQAGLVFVRRYQRRLFGLAVGIVGDTALAEDVAQEAFIRIFRHATMFDPRRGSVSSWALTITLIWLSTPFGFEAALQPTPRTRYLSN